MMISLGDPDTLGDIGLSGDSEIQVTVGLRGGCEVHGQWFYLESVDSQEGSGLPGVPLYGQMGNDLIWGALKP